MSQPYVNVRLQRGPFYRPKEITFEITKSPFECELTMTVQEMHWLKIIGQRYHQVCDSDTLLIRGKEFNLHVVDDNTRFYLKGPHINICIHDYKATHALLDKLTHWAEDISIEQEKYLQWSDNTVKYAVSNIDGDPVYYECEVTKDMKSILQKYERNNHYWSECIADLHELTKDMEHVNIK